MIKVAFLGELGSFSEIASFALYSEHIVPVRAKDFKGVFDAVISNQADLGVVPIYNSIVGAIQENEDLLKTCNVTVTAEYLQPIQLHLAGLAKHGSEVQTVYSHEKALGQCARFFDAHPTIVVEATSDTASAALLVKNLGLSTCAAICSERAAALFGLRIIEGNVQDSMENVTKFFAFSKK